MVRLLPVDAGWLRSESWRTGLTMSEIVRELIERQREGR